MIGGFCIRKCKKCELLEENYGTEKCAYYCTLCEKPVTEINWNECPLKLPTEKTEFEEYYFIQFQMDSILENYEKENGTKNNEMWKDIMMMLDLGDDDKKIFTNEERLILSKVYEKIDYLNETEYKKNEKYYDIWIEENYTINEQVTPESSSNYKSASSSPSSSYSSPYSSSSSSQSHQSQQQCVPKCPTCGSTNVAPISTGKKMLGLLTLGLASKGIGKSYCCKNCGYYW